MKSASYSSSAAGSSSSRSVRSTAASVSTDSNCSRNKIKLWGKKRSKQRRRRSTGGEKGRSASPPCCPPSHSSSSSTPVLPYLFKLIRDKQWKKLRRILKSSPREKVESLCQERDETDLTCLSLALGHQAPLDIVQQIVSIVPSMPALCDDYGANSLHVGCLNGMSLESLEFILREHKNDHLLTSLDCDLRSPLHQAVEYISTKIMASCDAVSSISAANTSNDGTSPGWHQGPPDIDGVSISYCVELLKMLCKAAPEMVHAQDFSGATPIDMIQLQKADCMDPLSERCKKLDAVYGVLKSASVELYRRKKETWEQKSKSFRLNFQQEGGSNKRLSPGSTRSSERFTDQSSSTTTTSSGSRTLSSSHSRISTAQQSSQYGGSRSVSYFGGINLLSNLHEYNGEQVVTRDIADGLTKLDEAES